MKLFHSSLLVILLCLAGGASADELPETPWPGFIGDLEPEISQSPVKAQVPTDVVIEKPGADVADDRAAWTGVWSGWAGNNRVADIKLIVEKITADQVVVTIVREMQGQASLVQRRTATFDGDEIKGTLESGTRFSYRMRNAETVEMLWHSGQGWMAGALGRRIRNSTLSIERAQTNLVENGKPVGLEVVIYKPAADEANAAKYPVVIFNHGSTGNGDNPSLFTQTWSSEALARYFNKRGWMVMFPQRRGRGKSDGLYDEGMNPDRSAYARDAKTSLAGFDRALVDIDAFMKWAVARPDVNVEKMILGGLSRGGILSVAYAGRQPDMFKGVINFVGGWMAGGIPDAREINETGFTHGVAYKKPSLWLYAHNDPYYSIKHSRKNFKAFKKAGGRGQFEVMKLKPDQNGHFFIFDTSVWSSTMDTYLNSLGLD